MITRWRTAALLLLVDAALSTWACARRTGGPEPGEQGPDESAGPPLFRDVTDSSGLRFTYRNGEESGHLAILESLGGGVALLDYNGDGLLDIFLPGGGLFDRSDAEFQKD